MWTDRSKSFSVEAQLLGVKDGKINLHKVNGVKIAVPVAKMSAKDLEYVELITGISLDEDRPLSDVKRAQSTRKQAPKGDSSKVGASLDKPEYDWFQFFLSCDVAVGLCERYAQAFAKDSMDETVLPDVDASVLRNLGLREGDIIKVMRYLDKKYGRDAKKRGVSFAGDDDGEAGPGGLFSGPGGTLRNNTRKGRPAPATETNNTVDATAFSSKEAGADASTVSSPNGSRPRAGEKSAAGGFDDDAWDVKPSKTPEPQTQPAAAPAAPAAAPAAPEQPKTPALLTQAMQDLSLLSKPLEPEKIQPPPPPPQVIQPPAGAQQQPAATTTPAQQGASPAFFTGLAQQQTGLAAMPTGQPLGLGLGGSRQRPLAPQMTQGQPGLVPPPPMRPLSAPQSAQPSGFAPPPLQPQMTGFNDLNQQRLQQQQQFMGGFQPQQTGQSMMGFNAGPGGQQGMAPQPTGYNPGQQFMQPNMTGMAPMQQQQFSPMQNQPTGFPGGFNAGQQAPQQIAQPTGVNQFLPTALEPQRTGLPQMQTGIQPQQTGFGGGFGQGFNSNQNGQAPAVAPLQPQQTGPAPPVRFGVPEKIQPQATGRRANLSQASKLATPWTLSLSSHSPTSCPWPLLITSTIAPQNPFGF